MKKGGEVADRTRIVIRFIGVLAPLALALYGYMVVLGYAPADHLESTTMYIALCTAWAAYGIWQFFKPDAWKHQPLITLALYHIFGILFVLFVSGFSTFVLAAWAILALASYLYYGSYGYSMSIATLVLCAGLDLALNTPGPFESSMMLLNIIGVVFVSGSAAAIIYAYTSEPPSKAADTITKNTDHQRLVTIINNLADAVFVTDASGTIEIYNAASLNLLDTNADIAGKSVDTILKTRTSGGEMAVFSHKLTKAKHVIVDDSLCIGPSDDPTRLELTYAPIRGSYRNSISTHGSEGYIIIARDVTKEKSLEEERDEFISVVSHELRTPVTVAEGSISNALLYVER